MIDDQEPEVVLVISKDINYFDDQSSENAIVPINQNQPLVQNKESSQVDKYQAFSELLIVELNRRYDLRPRKGHGRPVKKVNVDDPPDKVVETPSVQPQNQSQENSTIEKYVPIVFNVERELERVKNPIPLFELSRNPGYK